MIVSDHISTLLADLRFAAEQLAKAGLHDAAARLDNREERVRNALEPQPIRRRAQVPDQPAGRTRMTEATRPVTVEQCEATKLLACPFCGGEPMAYDAVDLREKFVHWTTIRCEQCGAEQSEEYTSEAIAAWNTRATPPSSEAEPPLTERGGAMESVSDTARNGEPCWIWHPLWACGPQLGYYDAVSKWWRIIDGGNLTESGDLDKSKWFAVGIFPSHWSSINHSPLVHSVRGWGATPPSPAADAWDDLSTHLQAWRNAIILARDEASEGSEDPDADRSYWNHELRAFDRTFTALTANGSQPAVYLIRKGGAFYRPNAEGYTRNPSEAGRYTLDEAISHSHPNGPDGPRDGITYAHESEVAGSQPDRVVDVLRTALESAPIPGRGEEMTAFRDRQDKWLRETYAPALSTLDANPLTNSKESTDV